jgi:hypothetical protein
VESMFGRFGPCYRALRWVDFEVDLFSTYIGPMKDQSIIIDDCATHLAIKSFPKSS